MTEEVSINHALANKNDGVIYKTSLSCLDRFYNLTKRANTSVVLDPGRLHVEPGAQLPFMEDMARSFNIWIDYTGAMADHSRCLDSRLRGYDDIRDMVLELLELLEMNLDYMELQGSDHESEEEAMKSIREAVDELHFMANAIRRSSVQSQKFTLSSMLKNTEDFFFESCTLHYYQYFSPC